MATITVIRNRPPELGRCRDASCGKTIEWVVTDKGKRMPVDHPLLVERVVERADGTTTATIDAGQSHFATCPGAKKFRKQQTGKDSAP